MEERCSERGLAFTEGEWSTHTPVFWVPSFQQLIQALSCQRPQSLHISLPLLMTLLTILNIDRGTRLVSTQHIFQVKVSSD